MLLRNALRGFQNLSAKLQKNIDVGKFYGENVRNILILMENQ